MTVEKESIKYETEVLDVRGGDAGGCALWRSDFQLRSANGQQQQPRTRLGGSSPRRAHGLHVQGAEPDGRPERASEVHHAGEPQHQPPTHAANGAEPSGDADGHFQWSIRSVQGDSARQSAGATDGPDDDPEGVHPAPDLYPGADARAARYR